MLDQNLTPIVTNGACLRPLSRCNHLSVGILDWQVCLQLEKIIQKTSCDPKILDYTMSSVNSLLLGFFESDVCIGDLQQSSHDIVYTSCNYKTVM